MSKNGENWANMETNWAKIAENWAKMRENWVKMGENWTKNFVTNWMNIKLPEKV